MESETWQLRLLGLRTTFPWGCPLDASVTPTLARGEVKGEPLITTAVYPLGAQTLPLIPHSIKMRWEEQTQRTME